MLALVLLCCAGCFSKKQRYLDLDKKLSRPSPLAKAHEIGLEDITAYNRILNKKEVARLFDEPEKLTAAYRVHYLRLHKKQQLSDDIGYFTLALAPEHLAPPEVIQRHLHPSKIGNVLRTVVLLALASVICFACFVGWVLSPKRHTRDTEPKSPPHQGDPKKKKESPGFIASLSNSYDTNAAKQLISQSYPKLRLNNAAGAHSSAFVVVRKEASADLTGTLEWTTSSETVAYNKYKEKRKEKPGLVFMYRGKHDAQNHKRTIRLPASTS